MASITLKINGKDHTGEVEDSIPLLWVIRDIFGLTGTKYSCGIGQCGACTVLLDGQAIRSCSIPAQACEGKTIETIESVEESPFRKLQELWIAHQVPQCGYCQSGQIMNAIGLLRSNPAPNKEEILSAMTGNICRCGTYPRILKAIQSFVNEKS
ncbi:MAG: (2Fe-2S)-binding protein [Bacteroidota bacterium]